MIVDLAAGQVKSCSSCKYLVSIDKFNVRNKKTGSLRSTCKPCEAARLKERINQARWYVKLHLQYNPCVDCGETDIRVLEFDHVRGKKRMNVSDMISKRMSLRTIALEIDKCEVRCANDHRRKTFERAGGSYRNA